MPLLAVVLADAGRVLRVGLLAAVASCLLVTLQLQRGYWRGDLPFEDVTPELYRRVLPGR